MYVIGFVQYFYIEIVHICQVVSSLSFEGYLGTKLWNECAKEYWKFFFCELLLYSNQKVDVIYNPKNNVIKTQIQVKHVFKYCTNNDDISWELGGFNLE